MLQNVHKMFTSWRYLIAVIITLALLNFVLNFFPTPSWVFVAMFIVMIIWIPWFVWMAITQRRSEPEYIIATTWLLFYLLERMDSRLSLPAWWGEMLSVVNTLLIIWMAWYAIITWRRTPQKHTESEEA